MISKKKEGVKLSRKYKLRFSKIWLKLKSDMIKYYDRYTYFIFIIGGFKV